MLSAVPSPGKNTLKTPALSAFREVLLAQGLGRPPYRVGRAFSATVRDRKAKEDFGPRHRALGANAIVAKKSDANIRIDYLGRFAVCSLDKL